MKNLTIFILSIFIFLPISAQEAFRPIEIDGISPKWSHLFVDSSRIGSELSEGTQFLADFKVYPVGDSVAYFVFRDRANRNSGTFIEKVDLNTGSPLWGVKFDERQTGFHELPAYFGLMEDGTLELVTYRIAGAFNPVLGWSLGHFLRRVIDKETGEKLEIFYNDQFQEEETMFIFGASRVLKYENDFIYYIPGSIEDEGELKSLYEFKRFSKEADLLSIDSIILPLVNEGSVSSSFYSIPNGFTNLRFTGPNLFDVDDLRELNADDFNTLLDVFSPQLFHEEAIDITGDLPGKWLAHIWGTYDDLILVRSQDSAYLDFYGILPYVHFSVFDQSGIHMSDIDFGQPLSPSLITPARIPNTNDFLFFHILNPESPEKLINVWLLEESGASSLLRTFEIEDEREIRLSFNIEVLGNKDVLFFYTAQTRGAQNLSVNFHNMVMRIGAEDLGLTTSTVERNDQRLTIKVFPNPFNEVLNIDFGKPISGSFALFDLQGKLVADGSLKDQIELSWDASNLPSGVYVISIRSEGKLWANQVIKVD